MKHHLNIAIMASLAFPLSVQAQQQAIDISIDNIYITQSTQNYEKSVQLVPDRRGLLRVFVKSNLADNTARPPVRVWFYYNGVLDDSKTRTIWPNLEMTGLPTTIQAVDPDQSYNLAVPASWVRAGLQIVARVDPEDTLNAADSAYDVTDESHLVWPRDDYPDATKWPRDSLGHVSEKIASITNFRVVLVPVSTPQGGSLPPTWRPPSGYVVPVEWVRRSTPPYYTIPASWVPPPEWIPPPGWIPPQAQRVGDVTAANTNTYTNHLRDLHPVPEALNVSVHSNYYTATNPSAGYDATWTALRAEMNALRLAERSLAHYYAVFKPSYSSGGTGIADIGGYAAVGVDWTGQILGNPNGVSQRSGTFAHEVGHNFGLSHSPCGGAAGPDPNYPYPGGRISVIGYNAWQNAWHLPDETDVMGYCGYDWISDYQYKRALNWRATGSVNDAAVSAAGKQEEALLIWGYTDGDAVILEPTLYVVGAATPEDLESDYSVELLDDKHGKKIHHFRMMPGDHNSGQAFAFLVPTGRSAAARNLAESISASGGGATGVNEVRILKKGKVVAHRKSIAAVTSPTQSRLAKSTKLTRKAGSVQLSWDKSLYPAAMVRNADTDEVIGIFRNGNISLDAKTLRKAKIQFSDGVQVMDQQVDVE